MAVELEKLVEEIQTIDKQAFDMAVLVLKSPVLRHSLAGRSAPLRERFNHIANELRNNDVGIYQEWADQISESILDLNFVVADTGFTSLRLGDIIR